MCASASNASKVAAGNAGRMSQVLHRDNLDIQQAFLPEPAQTNRQRTLAS